VSKPSFRSMESAGPWQEWRNKAIAPYSPAHASPLRLCCRAAELRREWIPRAVVIRQKIGRVAVGRRLRALGQHGGAPGLPVRLEAVEHVLVALLEIAALARILHHVEQELVAGDLEIFPVALAQCAL